MYPLLPVQKLTDNTGKIIQTLLMMYKRHIDRASATVFLNSVIYTTTRFNASLMQSHVDSVINTVFDLICANPDFEKPVAVRSHNEVLRCYDLIAKNHGEKINELILMKFKSNDNFDKVKALILLTHLTNTNEDVVKMKVDDFLIILRQMMMTERTFKIKQIILRAIIAFSQKGFIKHKIFIKFITHYCCHLLKIEREQGTSDEASELVLSCNNALIILSRTLCNGLEILLKYELFQTFMQYEYTDAVTTFAKCLTALLQKDERMIVNSEDEEEKQLISGSASSIGSDSVNLPSPESIFVRSLVLLANFEDKERIKAILNMLLVFCPNLSKHLQPLWNERIKNLLEVLKINDDDKFYKDINIFIMDTIKDIDDSKFSESLVNKMADQFNLYQVTPVLQNIHPSNQHQLNTEVITPSLRAERGMLMKILGLCLCYVTDHISVDNKIEIIINLAKAEKLEKTNTYQELEDKFYDPANALGYISKVHYELLMKKFESIITEDTLKKSSSFFSSFHLKDGQKELEKYKLKILIIFTYSFVVQHTSPGKPYECANNF
jgi:maestro heat-like repeat-containing protein family member 1